MIVLTDKPWGYRFAINPSLIMEVRRDSTNNTVVEMVTGRTYTVEEGMELVIKLIGKWNESLRMDYYWGTR